MTPRVAPRAVLATPVRAGPGVPPRKSLAVVLRAALASLLLLAPPPVGAPRDPRPALHGPIGDFWSQVKRDWARKIPGLREGPDQTPQWVSLVYGGEGEDEALADLLEQEMREWARWQRRRWVRSEFWSKRYDALNREGFYGSRALRQNLVVLGTPGSNPMIGEMTSGTPFRIEGDEVRIGDRDYRGASLVLAFIRPNPFAAGATYALVIAATRDEALLDLGRLPMGQTDYVLFRGAHPVEQGFLDWPAEGDLELSERRELRPDHEGWWAVAAGSVTVRFHPQEVAEEEALAFGRRRAADLPRLAAFFGLSDLPEIHLFLYGTADSKIRHTGQPGPVSVDLAGNAVHRVLPPGGDDAAWPEAMLLAWRAWGPTDLRGLLLGLSLLPDGAFEGRPLDAWAARLLARDGLPPVEDLMVEGPPWRDGEGERALQALALGSFLARVERDHGREALARFTREARALDFRARFREALGMPLGKADRDWRQALAAAGGPEAGTGPEEAGSGPPAPSVAAPDAARAAERLEEGRARFRARQDAAAAEALRAALALDPGFGEAHLLLARLAFRGGRDAEALAEAAEALRLAGGDAATAAWARVTLGRAHATRGEAGSARLELGDPAIAAGPDAPRRLAALWLENLGLGPSRGAAARVLAAQAEIDLMSLDWDAAERRALQILSADPGNAPAHHLLARVRLDRFAYWYDFASLYNELFPNTTRSDPLQYYHLVQSSHRESMKGYYLESGERGPLDLDVESSRDLETGWVPDALYPVLRQPAAMTEASEEVLRGRAFLLAGDYPRAAAHLRAALALTIPVSDARAWALLLLAQAEIELGETALARAHLAEAHKIARKKSLVAEIDAALERLEGPPPGTSLERRPAGE